MRASVLLSSIAASLPTFLPSRARALKYTAAISLGALLVYVAGTTVSFVVQLFEVSAAEASKFIQVLLPLLQRPVLDLDFLPDEFQRLPPTPEGVYEYAPASYHPFLFRRSPSLPGAWEWSDGLGVWFDTDNFRDSTQGVPEPPALIFILRLHVEALIRRRRAGPPRRRLPPPIDTAKTNRRLDAAPDCLCCPISHALMRVPVVAPSGATYEHECIQRWVQQQHTDPVNGAPLSEEDLYPNLALRHLIETWLGGTAELTDGEGDGGPGRGP
ncbi:hypothetical protein HYH03_018623 [Edaphochlamys debaryana]|uniref:U-box domain-containing protein n=1 Tax=Edaphochlamys debaryana TaxID=47281 RepID=A0A836BP74_9CHLO|nr:hypothetical protein HYH03_018623 [Edaphochlamys debaryana]|eukprot:KAG2482454.1 hypothetical protein HYH03_018623 [Edaphochlamys debaryana]